METTLVIVKPDGVERGLIGEVVGRFERKGLTIAGLRLMRIDQPLAERHYAVHKGKPFYDGLLRYITSGPVVVMAVQGPDAVATVRRMIGSTKSNEAASGTIRGDFGLTVERNIVHASDAVETAEFELGLYFRQDELVGA